MRSYSQRGKVSVSVIILILLCAMQTEVGAIQHHAAARSKSKHYAEKIVRKKSSSSTSSNSYKNKAIPQKKFFAGFEQPNPHILFIGDSHSVGVFGQTLTGLIKANIPKSHLTAVASCGSSPRWWLNGQQTRCGFWQLDADGTQHKSPTAATPLIADLLKSEQPDTVIVALGSNLIPQEPIDRYTDTVAFMNLIAESGSRCIWVGPPDARKFSASAINEVYKLLRSVTKHYGCDVVDSRKYTRYPATGRDGLHYGGEEGERIASQWAQNVFNQNIRDNVRYRFHLTGNMDMVPNRLAQAALPLQQIQLGQLSVQQ
ncbi:hypothetical protein VU07_03495 [Desulfobulbus sp. F4]|nr:hypothetical protein [Desulfobulbus sp. F3]MCW5200856.1 hypothetical protein [Desulfobulbus sp. F4]